jgi:quinol monooxygenase YgiN
MTMPDPRVHVTAHLRARPGALAKIVQLAERLVLVNRAEPGCLSCALHAGDDNELLMYEAFADEAAFRAHLASGHVRDFRNQSSPFTQEPLRVRRWRGMGILRQSRIAGHELPRS